MARVTPGGVHWAHGLLLPLGLSQGLGGMGLPMGFGTVGLWGAPALLRPRGEVISRRHWAGKR